MKEYRIYQCNHGGIPFCIHDKFKSLDECYIFLLQLVEWNKSNRYFSYIDNDFHKNENACIMNQCFYYQIQEREVSAYKVSSKNEKCKKIYCI